MRGHISAFKAIIGLTWAVMLVFSCQSFSAPKGARKTPERQQSSKKIPPKTVQKAVPAAPAAKSSAPVEATSVSAGEMKGFSWLRGVRVFDGNNQPAGEISSLVVDSQFLFVPWSTLNEMAILTKRPRFFVNDGVQPALQEAKVVEVDIANNIALLRLNSMVVSSAYRSQLVRSPGPMDPVGTTFGDLLIGLTSSGQIQFLADTQLPQVMASGKTLYEMLRRQDTRGPAAVQDGFLLDRRKQLYFWQEKWTQQVSGSGILSTQGMKCRPQSLRVSDVKISEKIARAKTTECQLVQKNQLGTGYHQGLDIQHGEIWMMGSAADQLSSIGRSVGSEFMSEQEKDTQLVNVLTPVSCKENTLRNSRGGLVVIQFCTSALKFESGLGDTVMTVVTSENGARSDRVQYAVARMRGFNQSNSKKIIEVLARQIGGVR